MSKLSFVLLFAIIAVVQGGNIYLNSTALDLCYPTPRNCSILNESIYNTTTFGEMDSFFFQIGPEDPPLLLYCPEVSFSWSVGNITLGKGVTLTLFPWASIIANATYQQGGQITLMPQASLKIFSSLELTCNSTLTVAGTFQAGEQYMYRGAAFSLSADSTISCSSEGSFKIYHLYPQIYGTLNFAQNSTIYIQQSPSFYSSCTLNIETMPFIGNANFFNITTTFPAGLDGSIINFHGSTITVYQMLGPGLSLISIVLDSDSVLFMRNGQVNFLTNIGLPQLSGGGKFVLSSSTLTANVLGPLLKATTLVLGGKTQVFLFSHLANFTLDPSLIQFTTGETGEQPYVSMELDGPLNILQNWNVPGELTSEGPVSLRGSISFTGGISVTSSNLVISGSLTCGGPVVLSSNSGTSCELIASQSEITAPFIVVNQNCTINPTTPVNITGDVLNNGTILTSEENHIIVKGNYTQVLGGVLVTYGLSPASKNINLQVSGRTSLAGKLQYNVSSKPKQATKYTIVSSNSSIVGNFSEHSVSGDAKDTRGLNFQIDYSEGKQICITLTPPSSSHTWYSWVYRLVWYYWVAIGGGALVLLVVVALLVWRLCTRKRSKYTSIQ